jgi:hypothetical protein
MLDGHRVWRFISANVSINYSTLRVDYSKLFLKSPYHTRIEWQIRFDLYLDGIKNLNLLLVWTLAGVVVLAIGWILVKLCAVCCCCCFCCCCDVVVVVVVVGVFFLFLFCIAALYVGFFAVTNVTFSALYVGFCIPLCRVLYPSCRVV